VLRNLCANDALRPGVLSDALLGAVHAVLGQGQAAMDKDRDQACAAQRAGLQLLANAAVGMDETQARIWAVMFPEAILRMAGQADRALSMLACAVVYQCTAHSPARCRALAGDEGAPLVAEMVARIRVAGDGTGAAGYGIEWALLALGALVDHGQAGRALDALDAWRPQGDVGVAWLDVLADDILPHTAAPAATMRASLAPLADTFTAVAARCLATPTFWAWAGGDDDSKLRRAVGAWLHMWVRADAGAAGGLMGLCEAVAKLLLRAAREWPAVKPRHHSHSGSHGAGYGYSDADMYGACTKADLVRLAGTLAHAGGRSAQDILRQHGALEGLLNSCQLDDRNPVIKDWCVSMTNVYLVAA
jgi:hypothetical protein